MDVSVMLAQATIEDFFPAVENALLVLGYYPPQIENMIAILQMAKVSHIAGLEVKAQLVELVERLNEQRETE